MHESEEDLWNGLNDSTISVDSVTAF